MPSPVEARSGSEVHNEQTCRLPWLRASVTSKWLRKGSWFAWLTVSLDTSHQKANLSRRKEHRSWARQAGLSCGKERHGGSQAPLPRLLSSRVLPTNMGRKIHIYFQYSQPAYLGTTGFPVHLANTRYHGIRQSRHPSHSSRVQHWSNGKRSCHDIGDEHSVLYWLHRFVDHPYAMRMYSGRSLIMSW